jgi:hypothetical protein
MDSTAMATTFAKTFTAQLNISRQWCREQAGPKGTPVRAENDGLWGGALHRVNNAATRAQEELPQGEQLSRAAFDQLAARELTGLRQQIEQQSSRSRSDELFAESVAWLVPELPGAAR